MDISFYEGLLHKFYTISANNRFICRAASAIMDALSRLSVLYQDSSLIATSGGRKTSIDAAAAAASSLIGSNIIESASCEINETLG